MKKTRSFEGEFAKRLEEDRRFYIEKLKDEKDKYSESKVFDMITKWNSFVAFFNRSKSIIEIENFPLCIEMQFRIKCIRKMAKEIWKYEGLPEIIELDISTV